MNRFVALGRSLIKIMNNNGPNMDPCGTPNTIGNNVEAALPILTNCFLEDKYDWNISKDLPLIPYFGNFAVM